VLPTCLPRRGGFHTGGYRRSHAVHVCVSVLVCVCVWWWVVVASLRPGFNLFYYLEQSVVRDESVFEAFFKQYLAHFAHQSITCFQFQRYFLEYFSQGGTHPLPQSSLDQIDWDAWFYNTGMPPVKNRFDDSARRAWEVVADSWCVPHTKHVAHVASSLTVGWGILCVLPCVGVLAPGCRVRPFLTRLATLT